MTNQGKKILAAYIIIISITTSNTHVKANPWSTLKNQVLEKDEQSNREGTGNLHKRDTTG